MHPSSVEKILIRCLSASCLILVGIPAQAQVPSIDIKLPGVSISTEEKQDREGAASKEPAPTPAKLEGNRITSVTGQSLELQEKKVMLPYPELEVLAPEGAEVSIYYDANKVHEAEVPFLFKDVKIDQYLKLVVKESDGRSWSVKFMPKKGHRTVLTRAGAVAAPKAAQESSGSCTQVLLAQGHAAMHLDACKGVDQACAVAVLQAGHHPQELSHCELGIPMACVKTLLKKGHHPMEISNCKGVNESCAVALLERGDHPMHLSNCE